MLLKKKIELISDVGRKYGCDYIFIRSQYMLRYLFSEVYSPPPEEVLVDSVVIDVNSKYACVYVPLLDYERFVEVYKDVDNAEFIPVCKKCTEFVDIGRKIHELDEVRKELKELVKERRVGVDSYEVSRDIVGLSLAVVDLKAELRLLRRRKVDEEVGRIRKAIKVAEKAFENFLSMVTPGMDEHKLALELTKELLAEGAEGIAFPVIVAVGKNAAYPHHIPKKNTVYTGKEPILVDFGARVEGYVSDITRMIVPKNIDSKYSKVLDLIHTITEAIDNVVKKIKAGTPCRDLVVEVHKFFEEKKLPKRFIHGLGHGIGVDVHEHPSISLASEEKIIVGDVVTIEPGIYIPSVGGVRIEEDVYVTEAGCEVLTRFRRVIEL